jgi:hypothetical protein
MILRVVGELEVYGRRVWRLDGGGYFVESGGFADRLATAVNLARLLGPRDDDVRVAILAELDRKGLERAQAGHARYRRSRFRVIAGGAAA